MKSVNSTLLTRVVYTVKSVGHTCDMYVAAHFAIICCINFGLHSVLLCGPKTRLILMFTSIVAELLGCK